MRPRATAFLYLAAVFLASGIAARTPTVTLLGQLNGYPSTGYTDLWAWESGDGTLYALQGVNAGVSIIDLTDPAALTEVDFVPFVNAGWYDIKTYGDYAYVSSEGSNDVLIVDLSPLPDSARVVGTVGPMNSQPHNVYVDTDMGVLYVVEDFNFTNPVSMYGLSDPEAPNLLFRFNATQMSDAHDVFVQDSVLYVAEGSRPTIGIFDVSDPSRPVRLARFVIPAAGYVHNVWVSEDGQTLYSTEETPGHTVKAWDIGDLNNISLLGEYLAGNGLAHNVMVRDGFAFLSHYESGLRILDVSDPAEPVEVGSYDTYPGGENPNFNGAWGIYPFAGNDRILINDIQSGLYVFAFDSVRAGGVSGIVSNAASGQPIPDATVALLEARISTTTDTAGAYALRTYAGTHTMVVSRLGYFSDTLAVTLSAGPSISQPVALTVNAARLALSRDSLGVLLSPDTVASFDLIVRNSGPDGRLDYRLDDVNGPLPDAPAAPAPLPRSAFRFDGMAGDGPGWISGEAAATGDTILVDPVGDSQGGPGGDAVALLAETGPVALTVTIDFAAPISTDSLFGVFALDLDFDPNTGAFPGGFGFLIPANNMGSDVDVLIDLSGNVFGTPGFYLFDGANSPGGGSLRYSAAPQVSGTRLTLEIPWTALDNDDGNLLIAGFTGHVAANGNIVSIDGLPEVGNGTIGLNPFGDLSWMDLSRESGRLGGGEADTVTVTIDTRGLPLEPEFRGWIAVTSNDPLATTVAIPVVLQLEGVVGLSGEAPVAETFRLEQNYPNPFNPATTVAFALPEAADVRLAVYDLLGREIAVLTEGPLTAGTHSVRWEGRDDSGRMVSSGVYFYRLEAGEAAVATRRMILLR